jgi:hypothetical protein
MVFGSDGRGISSSSSAGGTTSFFCSVGAIFNTASMEARLSLAQQIGNHRTCGTDDPDTTMAIAGFERKIEE